MYYHIDAGKFGLVVFILIVLIVVTILGYMWVSAHRELVVSFRKREAMIVQEFYGGER